MFKLFAFRTDTHLTTIYYRTRDCYRCEASTMFTIAAPEPAVVSGRGYYEQSSGLLANRKLNQNYRFFLDDFHTSMYETLQGNLVLLSARRSDEKRKSYSVSKSNLRRPAHNGLYLLNTFTLCFILPIMTIW